jgi:hypothetical protein
MISMPHADDAGDFFDEIDFAREVAAEAWRHPAIRRFAQAKAFEDLVHAGRAHLDAEQVFHPVEAERNELSAARKVFGRRDPVASARTRDFHGDFPLREQEFLGSIAARNFQDQVHSAVACRDDAFQIHAALEAIAGVARQAELAGGSADALGLEIRALENDVGRAFRHAGIGSAHHTRKRNGALGVGDDEVLRLQSVGFAVESGERFARPRGTHLQVAAKFRGVERMQRLSSFQQDVVRHVDDVIDRTKPDGFEFPAEPIGRRADFNAGDAASGVEWAEFLVLDPNPLGRRWLSWQFRHMGRSRERFRRLAGQRCHFARHADVAEQVGAVGRDLEVEDGVALEEFADGRADSCFSRQNEETFGIFAEAELVGAAEHALAFDAAKFADFDGEIAGEFCAGQGERDFVPDLVVLRAADNLARGAGSVVDLADTEAVGLRVLHGFFDLGDDDVGDGAAGRFEAFDFHAGHGEERDQCIDGRRQLDQFTEPIERDFHWVTTKDAKGAKVLDTGRALNGDAPGPVADKSGIKGRDIFRA